VLTNGIDTSKYVPKYNNKGYALYFGRISKEKGVLTLLKAHNNISNDFELKIVGTGPLEDSLHKSFPKAEFLGYKTGHELNELIANAAFVIVPSEWYENCSMSVLEAMALGKPVIGSRIGGIPEQVEHDKTGFLFEMGNVNELAEKMNILHANPDLSIQMGQAARKKCENEYSLNNHFYELTEIYSELLGRDINKDFATSSL
jgi:glycosyltransferase involved in cell wall biosynthesis